MMPVMPAASLNWRAWLRAFCPVVASSTSSTSVSQPGASRWMTREILPSSSMRFFLLWRRPAVSQMTTSTPRALPAVTASKTTAAGSEPSDCRIMSTPERSAHTPSCSIAAARKVSAAPSSTFLPSALRLAASLPIVVVLPTPFTPMTRMTDGLVERFSSSPPASIPAMISLSRPLTSDASVTPRRLTSARSSSQMAAAVTAPTSDMMSVSSSSSKSSSSILVKELTSSSTARAIDSRVFLSPSASLPKNPIWYPPT